MRGTEPFNRLRLGTDTSSRTVPKLFGGASGKVKAVGAKKAAKAVGDEVKEAVGPRPPAEQALMPSGRR